MVANSRRKKKRFCGVNSSNCSFFKNHQKALSIFFFVTMNKVFSCALNCSFKNIKTGFWKTPGWMSVLLAIWVWKWLVLFFVILRCLIHITFLRHDNLRLGGLVGSKCLGSYDLILPSPGAVISSSFFLWLRFDFDHDLFASPPL